MQNTINRRTIKALIENNGAVFMLKDHKGIWEFPGGRVDHNETDEETLRREFKEELGIINIEIGPQISNFEFSVARDEQYHHFNVIVYKCQADLSKIELSDEHVSYEWVKMNDINKYQTRQGYKETIQKFQKSISKEK